jgi:hypothetical protein
MHLRFFHPPESQAEVASVYYQEQEFPPARFRNTGNVKKAGDVCGPPGPVMERPTQDRKISTAPEGGPKHSPGSR